MDKVAVKKLRELTGDGSQTFINNSSGTITGDFYKLQVITDSTFDGIYILGATVEPLTGVTIPAGTVLHNVTSIVLANGTVIGYTNPPLTGNIPA
tara:strand:+ start:207 stop:491 length:285 start_codon:yes stop_codon:yes gene_type:complete